ncbi:hypothetical protein PT015_00350 [Candidatus Mycobacterium wuenschmannii]|uniref:Lipoprotein n=1 Tax=Candidatus Mycobacterium wuenschmannii TaxID=3027808 RepID=A0ABY8VWJ8_9MYCO|nr:hypothetical protein [Candidatus Mycobacterium wuenschmannii]WIM88023.1 hypothetical protein PT015_00350 [Candidatus Mycobacterium wuenschmannii]
MTCINRVMALGAILVGAAIGLATPASAAPPPDGNYVGTVTETSDPGQARVGNTTTMHLSPCGDGCVHMQGSNWAADLHPEGAVWSGPTSSGDHVWFDENTLAGGMDWSNGVHLKTQMKRV